MSGLEKNGVDVNMIELYQINEPLPDYSFWIGKKNGEDYCIIYICCEPFMKEDTPSHAIVTSDTNLINDLKTIFTDYIMNREKLDYSKLGEDKEPTLQS